VSDGQPPQGPHRRPRVPCRPRRTGAGLLKEWLESAARSGSTDERGNGARPACDTEPVLGIEPIARMPNPSQRRGRPSNPPAGRPRGSGPGPGTGGAPPSPPPPDSTTDRRPAAPPSGPPPGLKASKGPPSGPLSAHGSRTVGSVEKRPSRWAPAGRSCEAVSRGGERSQGRLA